MNWLTNKSSVAKTALAMLAIIHLIGLVGINSSYAVFFESIAWLNLLLSFLTVIVFHANINGKVIMAVVLVFIVGMAVETAGVRTGQPFGQYLYTGKFGWQVFGVPLIIGVNWVLLTYASGNIARNVIRNKWIAALCAAFAMVFIDMLLEPFAIRHGFWVWHDGLPPLQNYLAWFFVSMGTQLIFTTLVSQSKNFVAWYYLLLLNGFLIADLCIGQLKLF